MLELVRSRAIDELAGRTVWSATSLPAAPAPAQTLDGDLRASGEGSIGLGSIEVSTGESLRELARGLSATELPDGVRIAPGDVVVLHDPLVTMLAQAVRDHGAHAVWHVTVGPAPRGAAVPTQGLFDRFAASLDAYVTTWRRPVGRRLLGERLTALMPSAGVIATKALTTEPLEQPSGWCCLLAEVVQTDRDEHVGGTLHARPAIAPH
jgi:hypothetical protein